MADQTVHPFETAGLGKAPFRFRAVTKNLFTIPGVPEATKPGSSCDFCATGITYEYWCQGSGPEDRRFKVGCDCVEKLGWQDKFSDDVKRAAHRLKAQVRKDSENLRIAKAKALLAGPEGEETRFALKTHPHPDRWQAEQGRTLLNYVEFLLDRGGHTGQIKAVRLIKRAKRATDAEITTYRKLSNEWEAEAAQGKAKDILEADRRKSIALSATNSWVIQELSGHGKWGQFGDAQNFAASIIASLKAGQPVAELPPRAKSIILDILTRGYRGRAGRERLSTVEGYLEPSDNPYGSFQEQCESGELAEWERDQERPR